MINKNEPPFNTGAAIYDSFTFLCRPAELTAEKAQLLPGQNVLDIACGSGWATIKAARLVGEKGHVTGIDIADKLLGIAKQKTGSNRLTNIDYREGDVHDLDFSNMSFDAVLCASSLFLFKDRSQALRECYRVLKTGGIMIFSTFGEGIFQPVTGLINDYLVRQGENMLPHSPVSITDSAEKCRKIFFDAGFKNVIITEACLKLSLPDKEECWRQVSGSLIVRPRLSALDSDVYTTLKEEIVLELEQLCTPQGVSVHIPVIFSIVMKL